MIYAWIFIIVFPIVFLLQMASTRSKNKRKFGKARLSAEDVVKVLISSCLLTIVAYIAYFIGILRD